MTRSAKDMNEAYQQLDKEDKKVDVANVTRMTVYVNGAAWETWTPDLRITSALLYQLS